MASKRTDQGNDLPIPIINVPDSPRLQRINSYKPEDFPTSLSKIQSLAENESMSTDSDSALGTDDDEYDITQRLQSKCPIYIGRLTK